MKILIGTGTCGLASGAGEVVEAARAWARSRGVHIPVAGTGCVGFCQAEPILDVVTDQGNRVSFGQAQPEAVPGLLESAARGDFDRNSLIGQYRNGARPLPGLPFIEEHPYFRKQVKFVLRNCGVIRPTDLSEYTGRGGLRGLERALSMGPEQVIEEITRSGLRGRGGGGFPTGKKWRFAFREEAERKFVICNADEGDPGAFMDRSILEGDPFALIEGMIIAGYAIGASDGIIYCRAEYPLAIERLEQAMAVLRRERVLDSPLGPAAGGRPRTGASRAGGGTAGDGFSFSLKIKKGAGAFVCGEETALIASVEGRRGMPRPRPPYPAVSGAFGCPTVINNVETLANVTGIMREGADYFTSLGTESSRGTKVFALTGKISNTGLVEVPMGITLREIIEDIGGGVPGGRRFKAVQIGGPSGGCIPEQHLDIRIDYESLKQVGAMMGSGGLVVMDQDTCMVDVARYFLSFITSESCGKCIPCREGTKRMFEILDSIVSPYSRMTSEEANLERFNMIMNLENLASVIQDTSLCGLGQTAPNPVLSTLRFFKEEYDAHIYDRRCPAGACKGLLEYRIDTDLCTGCTACARACPSGAVVGERKKAHYILADRCVRCGACAEACRFEAVKAS